MLVLLGIGMLIAITFFSRGKVSTKGWAIAVGLIVIGLMTRL